MIKIFNRIKRFFVNFFPIFLCSSDNKIYFKSCKEYFESTENRIRGHKIKLYENSKDDNIAAKTSMINKIFSRLDYLTTVNINNRYKLESYKIITNNRVEILRDLKNYEGQVILSIQGDFDRLMRLKIIKPKGQKFIPIIDPYGEENWEN